MMLNSSGEMAALRQQYDDAAHQFEVARLAFKAAQELRRQAMHDDCWNSLDRRGQLNRDVANARVAYGKAFANYEQAKYVYDKAELKQRDADLLVLAIGAEDRRDR